MYNKKYEMWNVRRSMAWSRKSRRVSNYVLNDYVMKHEMWNVRRSMAWPRKLRQVTPL